MRSVKRDAIGIDNNRANGTTGMRALSGGQCTIGKGGTIPTGDVRLASIPAAD